VEKFKTPLVATGAKLYMFEAVRRVLLCLAICLIQSSKFIFGVYLR